MTAVVHSGTSVTTEVAAPRRRRLRSPGAVVAAAVLVLMAVAALRPELLTRHDPLQADPLGALLPPSGQHWFGTDHLGRDLFARVVHGAGHSLTIGLVATGIAAAAALLLGVVAGLSHRVVDEAFSRAFDALAAFPELLLALLFITFTGPGTASIILAIAVFSVPRYARVVRAQTLVTRRAGYVEQALTLGLSRPRLVIRHVLPNVLGPLPVLTTIGLGLAIINAAALSFLGMGPQPPTPEWGVMLAEGRNYLRVAWWAAILPGAAITLTVVSLTVVGRRMQRRFEGRSG